MKFSIIFQMDPRRWIRGNTTSTITTDKSAVNSTNQILNDDDVMFKSNKLTYIVVSICLVVAIGLAIACFIYRQKLNSIKSKYFSSNSKADQSQLSVVKMENMEK